MPLHILKSDSNTKKSAYPKLGLDKETLRKNRRAERKARAKHNAACGPRFSALVFLFIGLAYISVIIGLIQIRIGNKFWTSVRIVYGDTTMRQAALDVSLPLGRLNEIFVIQGIIPLFAMAYCAFAFRSGRSEESEAERNLRKASKRAGGLNRVMNAGLLETGHKVAHAQAQYDMTVLGHGANEKVKSLQVASAAKPRVDYELAKKYYNQS